MNLKLVKVLKLSAAVFGPPLFSVQHPSFQGETETSTSRQRLPERVGLIFMGWLVDLTECDGISLSLTRRLDSTE